MSTARMRQLIAAVDISRTDAVTKELLDQGVLHFVNIRELDKGYSDSLTTIPPSVPREYYGRLRRQIESYLALADIRPDERASLDVHEMEPVDTEKTEGILDNLSGRINEIRERQRELQQEILRLQDLSRQIDRTGGLGAEMLNRESGYLVSRAGRVPEENSPDLKGGFGSIPSVVLPLGREENTYLVVYLKRDRDRAERVLSSSGWTDIEVGSESAEVGRLAKGDLEARIEELRSRQREERKEVVSAVEPHRDDLVRRWANLKMNELCAGITSYYGKTSRTMLFSGWVPENKREDIDRGIRRAAEGKCYLEWHSPRRAEGVDAEETPVKFTNPRFLAPFQMLVENYAVPAYGSFDPTPIVAVAYLIMFGLMFGDAGHGLVLVAAGIVGTLLLKGKPIRRLFQLITWCGASAMVFGALFGSYFGMGWLPPVWFDYHGAVLGHAAPSGFVKDIYGILTLTIYFGIAVIGIGLVINWYNRVRRGEWFQLVMDKAGLLGGWMYGGGIYTAFYFGNHEFKQLPGGTLLFFLLGLPAILFVGKPVIEHLREKRHGHGKPFGPLTIVDFFMEWLVEMLEIFSGYLANTLSFMRVAGLGIAHVSLMVAFFEMADMAGGGGGLSIGSILILVVGNVLVIALEGLSAGIQSLRLNYYEFFSKYFSGTGVAYTPVTLKQYT